MQICAVASTDFLLMETWTFWFNFWQHCVSLSLPPSWLLSVLSPQSRKSNMCSGPFQTLRICLEWNWSLVWSRPLTFVSLSLSAHSPFSVNCSMRYFPWVFLCRARLLPPFSHGVVAEKGTQVPLFCHVIWSQIMTWALFIITILFGVKNVYIMRFAPKRPSKTPCGWPTLFELCLPHFSSFLSKWPRWGASWEDFPPSVRPRSNHRSSRTRSDVSWVILLIAQKLTFILLFVLMLDELATTATCHNSSKLLIDPSYLDLLTTIQWSPDRLNRRCEWIRGILLLHFPSQPFFGVPWMMNGLIIGGLCAWILRHIVQLGTRDVCRRPPVAFVLTFDRDFPSSCLLKFPAYALYCRFFTS